MQAQCVRPANFMSMVKRVGRREVKTPPPGWKAMVRLLLAAFTFWVIMGPKDFIVWKYGVTTKHEKGRYPQGLPVYGLEYKVQYAKNTSNILKSIKSLWLI